MPVGLAEPVPTGILSAFSSLIKTLPADSVAILILVFPETVEIVLSVNFKVSKNMPPALLANNSKLEFELYVVM